VQDIVAIEQNDVRPRKNIAPLVEPSSEPMQVEKSMDEERKQGG
jgi:hypothetical protein